VTDGHRQTQTHGSSLVSRQHSVARVTRSSANADGPRDALCQSKSCQLLRHCMWTTCRPKTIQEQAEAIESEGYSWPACNKQPPRIDRRRCRQQAPPSTSFLVNTIDLPWRNFFKSGVCCKISREKHPYFRRYSNFLTTQCGIGGRKLPRQNQLDSSCCFDTLLACGGQTDGQTDRHAMTAYEWINEWIFYSST